MPSAEQADRIELLRANSLHVTPQRLAVLLALSASPHSTADDVCRAVRSELGTVSRQAVYDALAVLTERGVLRRIEPAGSAARYEDRVGDNHHHLVCRVCGSLMDVDCAVGEAPCLTPRVDAGHEIDEAEVVYRGRCAECAVTAASAAGAGTTELSPPSVLTTTNHERDRRV